LEFIGRNQAEKNFLHLRREQGAGRLNKHTMRKLGSRYVDFFKY